MRKNCQRGPELFRFEQAADFEGLPRMINGRVKSSDGYQ